MNRKQKILEWITKNKVNIFGYFIFVIIFVWLHGERIINNFKAEGIKISTQTYQTIDGQILSYPIASNNSILLFWATWCAPCKVEMKRLKRSVDNGTIKANSIFLLNPFEEKATMVSHLKKHPYPFVFLIDENNSIAKNLNITQTPTMLLLKGSKIEHMSSGISLTGIYQAESFLKR